jgi:hypothetical protein
MFVAKLVSSKVSASKKPVSQQTTMVSDNDTVRFYLFLLFEICCVFLSSDIMCTVGGLFQRLGRLRYDGRKLRSTTFFNTAYSGELDWIFLLFLLLPSCSWLQKEQVMLVKSAFSFFIYPFSYVVLCSFNNNDSFGESC